MSPYQVHKLSEAIRLGYRTKATGERVLLSPQVANGFLMRIKAFQAKRGKFVYMSHYGPAVRTAQGYKPMAA